MKKLLKSFISVVTLLSLLLSIPLFAGRGDKSGTSAAPILIIPVGGRDLALGGSSIASTKGVEAVFYNPAGLSFGTNQSEAMFSHMNYIADIGVDFIAVSSKFEGLGTLAFTIKNLAIGDIPITTETNPDGTGEIFTPRFTTIGLTYSNALTDRIGIGFTTELITEQLDRVNSNGVAFSFGVQYHGFANIRGLDIGVSVKNIGPQMQYGGAGLLRSGTLDNLSRPTSPYKIEASKSELPSVIELGFAYNTPISDQMNVNVSSIFQNQNYSDDEYRFGAEFAYAESFFIRGGYSIANETVLEGSYIFGYTLGAGLTQNFDGMDFTFDYAYRDVDFFDANHVFSVKLGF